MKFYGCILLAILSPQLLFAQIKFEAGYFVNKQGKKKNCLIKNRDWRMNPHRIEYKNDEGDQVKELVIEDISEFGVGDHIYKRFSVKIDRSSDELHNLDPYTNPHYEEEVLFLRELLRGSPSLFYYRGKEIQRFFVSQDGGEVTPLVYKKYRSSEGFIGINAEYKNQLAEILTCRSLSKEQVYATDYKVGDLLNLFESYHLCSDSEYSKSFSVGAWSPIYLSVRPGIRTAHMSIGLRQTNTRDVDFGQHITFRLGLEAEYIFPFNRSKWSALLEPTYQYFIAESELHTSDVKVDYKSLDLSFGVRHKIYFNRACVFFDVSYVSELPLVACIDFESLAKLKIQSRDNWSLGLGFQLRQNFVIQFKYDLNRRVLGNTRHWLSEYGTQTLVIGYRWKMRK